MTSKIAACSIAACADVMFSNCSYLTNAELHQHAHRSMLQRAVFDAAGYCTPTTADSLLTTVFASDFTTSILQISNPLRTLESASHPPVSLVASVHCTYILSAASRTNFPVSRDFICASFQVQSIAFVHQSHPVVHGFRGHCKPSSSAAFAAFARHSGKVSFI